MSEASNPAEEPKAPKLVVDDDWKEQVAKEKAEAQALAEEALAEEALAEQALAEQAQAAHVQPPVSAADGSAMGDQDSLPPPPPASIEMLISLLFTQALGALGQVPNPATGKAEVNKAYAKHYIDTIEMLGEKTKGNLTDEEAEIVSEALHALRMAYVNTRA